MPVQIEPFFDNETATFSYILVDPKTSMAAVIDSVLNFDIFSGKTQTKSADEIILFLTKNKLKLEWILETHLHADHLTAAHYIKERLGGKIGISSSIKEVLKTWVPLFNTGLDTPMDASQFDKLFEDQESFSLGSLTVNVMHTPGHTPACLSYIVEDAIFVGDTLFMPDVGTARTDFPGGSASTLYDSIHRILSLPQEMRIHACHDYPPEGRLASGVSTVKEQREKNILIHQGVTKEEYVLTRNKRDEGKPVPKLLLPAIQVNLRAGSFGLPEDNRKHYIKIPINSL